MAKKKAATLFLHCKCNACTSWEILFEAGKYYLKCASCPEKIEFYMNMDSPHPSIHWEV